MSEQPPAIVQQLISENSLLQVVNILFDMNDIQVKCMGVCEQIISETLRRASMSEQW